MFFFFFQILHFSLNRLGELTNDTLKKYPDLGYVIIRENAISDIDTGAFTAQEDTLKGVDLTDNKLLSFPINTLAYPNFIRLYLGKNYLNDDALNYSIESGLEILELFDNKLTKLPSKLLLPDLTYLNVSKNKIIKIKTEQLARFCSLKVLDISKNPLRMSTCECHGLKKWINMRNITVIPVNIKCGKCPSFDDDLFMLNDTFKVYDKCIEKKLSRKNSMMKFNAMKFVSSWKFIVLFIVGIVMITIAVYCTCKKRNKKEGNLKINGKLVFAKNGSIKNQSDEAIDSSMKSSNDEFVTRL